MSCKVKDKTIKYLQSKDIINNKREVLDLAAFEAENKRLTDLAYRKYGVGDNKTKLFSDESKYVIRADGSRRFLVRAVPNELMFQNLEDQVDISLNKIKYSLKAVEILQSDKAEQTFKKGEKNNWDLNKILTELQIPKEQKQIILDKNIIDREEIITSLLAENSFVVEVNTATTKLPKGYSEQDYEEAIYNEFREPDYLAGETDADIIKAPEATEEKPTQHYSNLTVPGGTNYTENEIATPAITPSIKGHAQFATDNGIGWFRSDEQVIGGTNKVETKDYTAYLYGDDSQAYLKTEGGTSTKTRRILEVQSDLFQKGRGKKNLVGEDRKYEDLSTFYHNRDYYGLANNNFTKNGKDITKAEYEKAYLDKYGTPYGSKEGVNQNQFLQLLNKKNNWVTFFVKSIIQDSAKKGYEKVLFPKGDTAAKIEGHQTLEEFKKQKEDRIKELEEKDAEYYDNEYDMAEMSLPEEVTRKDYIQDNLKRQQTEINQLKQELADVESGQTQLSSIANFYENTVTNILKKNGYNPVEITDEYGNKWNEVKITPTIKNELILLKKIPLNNLLDNSQDELFVLEDNINYNKELDNLSEFYLFNNQDKNTFTANEILDNIINNYPELNDSSKQVIKTAKFLLGKTKTTVKFKELDPDVFMNYLTSSNVINIDKNKLNKYSDKFTVESFLHEIIHSVTVSSYRNPIKMEEKMFKSFIDEAYNYYVTKTSRPDLYGFSSPEEFIAEIFTNPLFQNEIQNIKSPESKKSIWAELINYIRMILGLPTKGKDISFNKIIEAITKVASIENNSLSKDVLYKKVDDVSSKDYTTSKNKLDNLLDSIDNNIREALQKAEYFFKRTKNEETKRRLENYIKNTKQILIQINNYSIASKANALITFVEFMNNNIYSIENRLNNAKAENFEEVAELTDLFETYLKTFSVIDNLNEVISDIKADNSQDILSKDEIKNIREIISNSLGKFKELNSDIYSLKKKAIKLRLNDIKYFPNVETKHYNRLSKEHQQSNILEDKETWIIDKMNNRDKDIIQEDLNNEINKILENPSYDVYSSDVMFSSAINVSAPLVQIFNQIINEINNKRVQDELLEDQKFKKLYERLKQEKGTNNIYKLYENIIDKDDNGKVYLKSDYKATFYTQVQGKIKSIIEEYGDKITELKLLREEKLSKGEDVSKINKEIKKLKSEKQSKIVKIKNDNLIKNKDGKYIPKDKWKQNYSSLSKIEKEVLDYFKSIIDLSQKKTFGQDPLKTFTFGAVLYELPKITKSDTERIWSGDIKGTVADKWKDLTQVRADDVEYVERYVDANNEVVKKLRIHYRDRNGNFDNKDQSLDLFSIFRLEYKNANMYSIRKQSELELNFLLDIAKNKEYFQKEGTIDVIKRKISGDKEKVTISGEGSKTFKMMSNMMESKFYDIMNKNNFKLNQVDMNKAVSFINSASSFLALSLNIASGTANVVNAKAQLFLESFIKGDTITSKSIAKANRIYSQHLSTSIKDITSPINNSFVNKLNEYYNIHGLLNLSNSSFIKSDMLKAGFTRNSLQVFQNSGEHWVQSVITMSVLDGIKVLNKNGKFIDKNGKVVSEDKAASLLDMMEVDDTGIMKVSDKVVYTTHSRLSEWNNGGKEKVDALITKKIYDSVGNYRDIDQPDVMRHWLGKLGMLFRRYLVPMGQSRLRGIETSLNRKEDLTDDQLRYSYALQEYEEGTYTSLVRYIYTALKDKKFWLLSKSNWNQLSDYEKHNIKRAVVELVLTAGILPIVTHLVHAMAADDDKEYLFFLAYQLRRLDTELSQYRSISESFKVMRSPIPSARLIETTLSITTQVFSPWAWDDKYKAGYNRGENKLKVKVMKQIPLIKEFKRTYEDLYQFQNSTFQTGL